MRVRRNAFGRQIDSTVEKTLTVYGNVEAAYIRAPEVISVGTEVNIIATRGKRIVGVETPTALAISFHPELTGSYFKYEQFLCKSKPNI